MARLRKNKKTGCLYIRIPRGIKFTNHSLNTYGEERVRQAGVNGGERVPDFLLQQLDANNECFPACGAFKGQQEFPTPDFSKVERKPKQQRRKMPAATSVACLHIQLYLGETGVLGPDPQAARNSEVELLNAFIAPELASKVEPFMARRKEIQMEMFWYRAPAE